MRQWIIEALEGMEVMEGQRDPMACFNILFILYSTLLDSDHALKRMLRIYDLKKCVFTSQCQLGLIFGVVNAFGYLEKVLDKNANFQLSCKYDLCQFTHCHIQYGSIVNQ